MGGKVTTAEGSLVGKRRLRASAGMLFGCSNGRAGLEALGCPHQTHTTVGGEAAVQRLRKGLVVMCRQHSCTQGTLTGHREDMHNACTSMHAVGPRAPGPSQAPPLPKARYAPRIEVVSLVKVVFRGQEREPIKPARFWRSLWALISLLRA